MGQEADTGLDALPAIERVAIYVGTPRLLEETGHVRL
ncbi:hypothetical protein KPB2_5542 [Klebsiella pneumoniae Kb677]|nr:hypothetical protein KPB2_5542 [Klebsiella pneumoniae Kb677]